MKINNKAFTLVELLVVVLIIGILAAIAVPQYQKAVEKARMSEAIMAVEKIAQAQDIYKLATGNYTRNINDLDINMKGEDILYAGIIPAKQGKYFIFSPSNASGNYQANIAVVTRIPQNKRYLLSINIHKAKSCSFYGNVSDYEKELCNNWANN